MKVYKEVVLSPDEWRMLNKGVPYGIDPDDALREAEEAFLAGMDQAIDSDGAPAPLPERKTAPPRPFVPNKFGDHG